ncbi:putative serine/threonine-protein kinase ste20-like [Triplophysa rosa]|uniref:non-specific serine/threonine protein kinase n=1 Tax=Triplophysa rosa TaxID=992332 RepID=A0A9W8CC20_TRIRA|nr:putative serine/threonine-protein kinase ste20-like [Triplophysa rosa]
MMGQRRRQHRGRKRKADEAFYDDEETEPAPKRMKHLTDSESATIPGPSTIMHATNISPAPETADDEAPSGINPDDPMPGLLFGFGVTPDEHRGRKRKADEAFYDDEEETEPAPKRMKHPTDSESAPLPGPSTIISPAPETPDDGAVAGPSGINPAPRPVDPVPRPVSPSPDEENGDAAPEPEQEINPAPRLADVLIDIPFPDRYLTDERVTNRYQVLPEEVLEHGRRAMAFAAVRRIDGRQVVLKCVPEDFTESREDPHSTSYKRSAFGCRAPVYKEISIMLQLQHSPPPSPHVINMLDWFEFPDGYVVVLERLSEPWVKLETFIQENGGQLSERVVQAIMRQLLQTFDYFIRVAVQHCDVCTNNIMINRETLDMKLIGFSRTNPCFLPSMEGSQAQQPFYEDHNYRLNLSYDHLKALFSLFERMFDMRTVHGGQVLENMRYMEALRTRGASRECRNFYLTYFRVQAMDPRDLLNHPWITNDERTSD